MSDRVVLGVRPSRLAALAAAAIVACALASCRRAAPASASADAIVSAAVTTARASGRVVLVEFGASWCVWCKHFDAFVNAPQVSSIVSANYIVTHLDVQEHDDKKNLDTPGGDVLMAKWGGADSGIPFYVFLDANGKDIATSNAMPGGANIGFPGNAKELDAFVKLIDQTAPKLNAADRQTLVSYLSTVVPQ